MKLDKDKESKGKFVHDDDWEADALLCPKCEGRGRVPYKDKRDVAVWGDWEYCDQCDGLGLVYGD